MKKRKKEEKRTVLWLYPQTQIDAQTIREIREKTHKMEAYKSENTWWYYFFQATGSNNHDVGYANSLRVDGISLEVAAEIFKFNTWILHGLTLFLYI